MFELTIRTEFCAAHAIVIRGVREPVHGHNWRVTLTVAGDQLDDDGLLCDFHELERALAEIVAPFQNADLNNTAPFHELNPTAEHIAQHIGESMAKTLTGGVHVQCASVTEAPGCEATWKP